MGPTRRGGGSRQLATVASVAELPPLGLSQNAPAKPSKSFHPLLFKSPYDWIVLFIVDLCPAPVVRYIGGFLVSEGSYSSTLVYLFNIQPTPGFLSQLQS